MIPALIFKLKQITVAAIRKDILQCPALQGIVRRISALPKDHPYTCSGARVSRKVELQVTAISAVQYTAFCGGRKWDRPIQNASMMTVNLTVRRQARLVASYFS